MNTPSQRAIVATLSLSTLLSSLGTSIANVALPALSAAFHAPPASVQWVVLAYLLGVSALVVAAGRLGDLVGRKRLLGAGILCFSLAAGLCALAPTLPVLVAARALQGAGAAAMIALTMAAVRDALPAAATARAMGLLGTVSAAGTALGPSLGGALVGGFGWRVVFLLQAVLGGFALLSAWRFLPPDTGPRVRRRPAPLVDLGLFRDRVLAAGFATNLLATAVVMASLVVGPYYLSGVLGLGNGLMGLAMAAGPVIAALAGVPAGRLVERCGAPRGALVGLLVMEAGACLLWTLPPAGPGAYVASLGTITAGYALFQAANNTAVLSTPAAERRGLVAGLLGLSRNLGLISGAAVMGAVFMQGAGGSSLPSPAALADGFRACFGVAALLLGVAILAARWLGKYVILHGQEATSDADAPRVG